jgi:hypothetical protein
VSTRELGAVQEQPGAEGGWKSARSACVFPVDDELLFNSA